MTIQTCLKPMGIFVHCSRRVRKKAKTPIERLAPTEPPVHADPRDRALTRRSRGRWRHRQPIRGSFRRPEKPRAKRRMGIRLRPGGPRYPFLSIFASFTPRLAMTPLR
jgi:hypothetical protein